MADEKVRKVQQWLNSNYALGVDEDGYTGNKTVTALIKALQTELGLSADGSFGPGTVSKFNQVFPNGLNVETNPTSQSTKNIIYILRGGMYCRGINGGDIDTDDAYKFDTALSNDIKFMKELLGIDNPTDLTTAIEIKAVLTTDAYTLVSNGNAKVREIQQALNKKYLSIIGSYLATNGLYERYTNIALKKAVQYEIGVTPDGSWGDGTKSKLPALSKGSTKKNLIYLAQYLLFLNGFDPNGFDGSFGNGATNATKNFQTLMHLTVDGSIGPQTWFALAISCGDTSRSANACDTRFEITPTRAQVLKNAGYGVVGRYINGTEFKVLRAGELQVIFNAGLKAFFIYQESNRDINDFTYSKGMSAGLAASKCAKNHKIPVNSVIYFAVDLDVYENQIANYIIPYFKGISNAIDKNFKVGIYGPRLVCQKVSDENLAISSFVADMSSGFSCNIGQKIPSNWCYDQFKEISNFNGDFDIDKVTYNEKIPAATSIHQGSYDNTISKNEEVYNFLDSVYNAAVQYCNQGASENTIENRNLLVLDFLRAIQYTGIAWDNITRALDTDWLTFALRELNMQSSDIYNYYIYTNENTKRGLVHLSVTIEALMIWSNKVGTSSVVSTSVGDLAGWAGDLLQMIGKLNNKYHTPSNINDISDYIGQVSGESMGFQLEDFLQDIDAVNIFNNLYTTKISDVFRNYYNSYSNVYNNFLTNRLAIHSVSGSSTYDKLYNLAYQYIIKTDSNIQSVLSTMFDSINKLNFEPSTWAAPVATAFAEKMSSLINSEN